jgi:hypothetical protein
MTTLFRARQRAEEFAARVDGTTSGAPTRRADPGLEELLTLTRALQSHEPVVPREAFVADLRERLMAEAATALDPQNAHLALPVRNRARERRLVAAASALVVLGGTASMATAAQDALPGEALYPIKRGIEKAESTLSVSSAGRGRDLLHQADGRLEEVRGLVAEDSTAAAPQIPHTLDTFSSQAQQGADLLMGAYEDERDAKTIAQVRGFARAGLQSLERLAAGAPADAQPGIRRAAQVLQDIDARAVRLCDTCSGLPALQLPKALLVSAEVGRALEKAQAPAAGRLDNSHPVIVPKEAVRRLKGHAEDAGAARPREGAGAGAPDAQQGAPVPSVPKSSDLPSDPAQPLPTPKPPKPPKVKVKVQVGDQKVEIDNGLKGLVETLLPSPGDDGGLLR